MIDMNAKRIIDLPDEVIQAILSYVSPQSAVALETTCRRFRDVTNEPLIWKDYCRSSFRYWDNGQSFKKKLRSSDPTKWKEIYAGRTTTTLKASLLLDDIINKPDNRIKRIEAIAGLGYDAKDFLLKAFKGSPSSPNHLAQKYWTHVALGFLHRSLAIKEWANLQDVGADAEDIFERVIGAFDLFILHERDEGDIDDILDRINDYAEEIRTSHPEIDHLEPVPKAVLVADYLLQKGWIGISGGYDFHCLDHQFLGVSLHSPLRNSLPLISVTIYCAVLRKFSLHAYPCSFPLHVHAVISPDPIDPNVLPDFSNPTEHPFYMDPFNSSDPIPLSVLNEQLAFILRRMGAPSMSPQQRASYLLPASPLELTMRTAANIHNSAAQAAAGPQFPISSTSANYAANWALTLFTTDNPLQQRAHLAHLLTSFSSHFEHDILLIDRDIIPRLHHRGFPELPYYQRIAQDMRTNDSETPVPKLRSGTNGTVQFRVGQIFRHRLRGYLAVITGWDAQCGAAEHWIQANHVHRLARGRDQPFYNVVVAEDASVRYVAEDNIMVLDEQTRALEGWDEESWPGPNWLDMPDRFPISIGKFFKSWDSATARFRSNVLLEYPDDEDDLV